jgi:NAD(P)-dependent dehydrogenase (short-subunit alcohol dehydrogenase family)
MTPTVKLGIGIAAGAALLTRQISKRARYAFRDKVVFITGGSRGLGLAIARLLAAERAHLVLIARNSHTLTVAVQELREVGADVIGIPCDVQDREQVENAISTAVATFGSIDVVINDAGIMQVGPMEHMALADFETAMNTHAWGPLYVTLAALPHMLKQGQGRVVNISSIGGRIAVPHMLPYSMSKFALAGLSDGLGAELRSQGILVTTVLPGLTRTGSHVNAYFKGNNRAEFAWFAALAGNPLMSIKLERAARQIVEACRRGRPQLIITSQARLAVALNGLFPGTMSRLMSLIDRLLPKPVGNSPAAVTGWESSSKWTPSLLTKLADDAIEGNNEFLEA